jgi:Uma2 family endonuclease
MAKLNINSSQLTYEDYLLFPDDGKRHEIIEGDHYITPAPNTKHQRASGNLFIVLSSFARRHKLGEVFDAPYDVVLSEENVVQPDLVFVSAGRATTVTEYNIQGAPDLVIEIVSEATRKKDEVTKRKLYERFRVREYWIVDPELETVKVFRLVKRSYVRVAELTHEGQKMVTTPLLPGFRLRLGDIFR